MIPSLTIWYRQMSAKSLHFCMTKASLLSVTVGRSVMLLPCKQHGTPLDPVALHSSPWNEPPPEGFYVMHLFRMAECCSEAIKLN